MAAAACSTAILLGAYYYAWYGIGEQWEVFPRTFEPSMGTYNSSENFVMETHHRQGREACIQFFATSWGGDGSRSPKGVDPNQEVSGACELVDENGAHIAPKCTRDGKPIELQRGHTYRIEGWDEPLQWWTPSNEIDEALKRNLNVDGGVPMVLMYEIRDILGVGENQGQVDLSAGDNPKILKHHLLYAADHHFMHPNYYRINGCPVLFLYTLRDFHHFVEPLRAAFRAVEERIGTKLYVIGDVIWWNPPVDMFPWDDYKAINVSAITAYNLYDAAQPEKMTGAFPWYSAGVYASFTPLAAKHGIQVVPYVSPGYDDSKMRGLERCVIARHNGVSYLKSWYYASAVASQQPATTYPAVVMVNSFNEWHEGTQIEPSLSHGESFINLTREFSHAFAKWKENEPDMASQVEEKKAEDKAEGEEEDGGEEEEDLRRWVGRGEYGQGLPAAEEEMAMLARHHVKMEAGVSLAGLSDGGQTLQEDLLAAQDQIEAAAMQEAFTCGGRGEEAEALQERLLHFPWPKYKLEAQELRELCGYGGYEIIVQNYYKLLLGRAADHAGLIQYSKHLERGAMNLEELQDILLDSDEARESNRMKTEAFFENRLFPESSEREETFTRLRRIYLKTLRREPDEAASLRYLTDLFKGKIQWHDIQYAMSISEEAKNALRQDHKILYPGVRLPPELAEQGDLALNKDDEIAAADDKSEL